MSPRPTSISFGIDGGTSTGPHVSAGGGLAMVEGDAAIRQSVLMLLATSPGERVMRPAYGCDLDRLMFAPADDTTAGLAIHYVRTAIERWEQRVELIAVDAHAPPEQPGRLELVIDYRVRATGSAGRIARTVELEAP